MKVLRVLITTNARKWVGIVFLMQKQSQAVRAMIPARVVKAWGARFGRRCLGVFGSWAECVGATSLAHVLSVSFVERDVRYIVFDDACSQHLAFLCQTVNR